jgi:hypothetical protein
MIEQTIMDVMRKLDALDERSRMKLLAQVDKQRSDLTGSLLTQLGTSPSSNVQAAAIYLIGRHRLAEGVPELVQRLDFAPERKGIPEPEPLWEKYPAMEALITIGRPSIPAVLELLATETKDLRRDLAVKIVRYVEDAGVARFILERAHAAESNPDRKARLKDALTRLEKLPK